MRVGSLLPRRFVPKAAPELPGILQNVRVASPCPMDWEQMQGNDRVRHCSECNLNVFNLSDMTRRDAEQLIAGHEGRLCIRLYRRADGTIITRDCPWGVRALARRVSRVAAAAIAAMLSIGSAVAQAIPGRNSNSNAAQENRQKGSKVAVHVSDPTGAVVAGASVTITSGKPGIKFATTADRNGVATFDFIPQGKYWLTIQSGGFAVLKHEIAVGDRPLPDIHEVLSIGMVGEMVRVDDTARSDRGVNGHSNAMDAGSSREIPPRPAIAPER